jgi:hypothetical protein
MRGNPAIHHLARGERRHLLSAEAKARRAGTWTPWETITFPRGSAGDGWAAEFTTVHRNNVFAVLDRTLDNGIRHLGISSLSGERPTWPEAQRIKDELAGEKATAVEVYPPRAEVVDEADMYHLWIVPPLPFSLRPAPTEAPTG